ncbi:MAG: DUF86 domain-containing protein [Chloroflexi bacterium]|nr:MAG: DUF86 domain-containing protein [Chloroflexota bacterium]
MVLKESVIITRLKELDSVLQELSQYRHISQAVLQTDLSKRWIIERGLIAAASLILDIANHILSGHFGQYPDTYEQSLIGLETEKVISTTLYQQLKGLGGFRAMRNTDLFLTQIRCSLLIKQLKRRLNNAAIPLQRHIRFLFIFADGASIQVEDGI